MESQANASCIRWLSPRFFMSEDSTKSSLYIPAVDKMRGGKDGKNTFTMEEEVLLINKGGRLLRTGLESKEAASFSTAGLLFRCFDLHMHEEEKQPRESWPWGKEAEPGSKAETVARSVFLPSDTAL